MKLVFTVQNEKQRIKMVILFYPKYGMAYICVGYTRFLSEKKRKNDKLIDKKYNKNY